MPETKKRITKRRRDLGYDFEETSTSRLISKRKRNSLWKAYRTIKPIEGLLFCSVFVNQFIFILATHPRVHDSGQEFFQDEL
jgi:putative alpha-1,2-mannosidase